jgi:hypothetical protein
MKNLRIKGMIITNYEGGRLPAIDIIGSPSTPLKLKDAQKLRDWLNRWIDEVMVGEMKK